MYEYIVACAYYALIGASIAELASAIPSSGGVYHWASVTPGPRYGRMLGFFTGKQQNDAAIVGALLWPESPPSAYVDFNMILGVGAVVPRRRMKDHCGYC